MPYRSPQSFGPRIGCAKLHPASPPVRGNLKRVVIRRSTERVVGNRRTRTTDNRVSSTIAQKWTVEVYWQGGCAVESDGTPECGILVLRQPGTAERHGVERAVFHQVTRQCADVGNIEQNIPGELALYTG